MRTSVEGIWAFLQKMRPRFRCYYEIRYEGLLYDHTRRKLDTLSSESKNPAMTEPNASPVSATLLNKEHR